MTLFGSYTRGEANYNSDIDLIIVAKTDLPPEERFPFVNRALRRLGLAFDIILKTPEEYERNRKSQSSCLLRR
ncbi:MAG: nucleotidyltransferase domain-containing protein [Calditrichaeota bacterium]|nr:nucleotidyltransferase domain-containing protein [Calditrichota bacterium]